MENNDKYLRVARITKPVGLNGEVKVFSTTTFKNIRYKKGNKLFILINDKYKEVTIKRVKLNGKFDTLAFEEFSSLEEVSSFINIDLFTLKDYEDLKKNQFFYSDLESCLVKDEDNNILGTVDTVEEFPSQLTLKVKIKDSDKFFYVPFIKEFIQDVNIENKTIIIHLIEGLL